MDKRILKYIIKQLKHLGINYKNTKQCHFFVDENNQLYSCYMESFTRDLTVVKILENGDIRWEDCIKIIDMSDSLFISAQFSRIEHFPLATEVLKFLETVASSKNKKYIYTFSVYEDSSQKVCVNEDFEKLLLNNDYVYRTDSKGKIIPYRFTKYAKDFRIVKPFDLSKYEFNADTFEN